MFQNRLINAKSAVLCEGPIDTLKANNFGGNVCTMGKSVSATHVSILLRSGFKNIYAGFDPDAYSELDPLMSKLGNDINLYRVQVPDIKGKKADLGELSMEEAYRVIVNSEKVNKNNLYIWLDPSFFG